MKCSSAPNLSPCTAHTCTCAKCNTQQYKLDVYLKQGLFPARQLVLALAIEQLVLALAMHNDDYRLIKHSQPRGNHPR